MKDANMKNSILKMCLHSDDDNRIDQFKIIPDLENMIEHTCN
jgi:hypothetical protein